MKPLNDVMRKKLQQYAREHRSEIEDEVCGLYLSSAFTNRYVLHPRRLKEIAQDDVDRFIDFLDYTDEQKAVSCGRDRAKEGVGYTAFLNMGTTLRIHALRSADHQDNAVSEMIISLIDAFANARTAGFIEQLEILLLEDQEKMRIAEKKAEQNR